MKINKIWAGIALLIILISIGMCTRNSQLVIQGEKQQLIEQLQSAQDGVKVLKKQRKFLIDSISRENKKRDIFIDSLNTESKKKDDKIATLQGKLSVKKEKIKSFKANDVVEFINKRYDDKSTTALNEKTVSITDSIPVKIITELVEKDVLEEVVDLQEGQLTDKDLIIKTTNEKVLSKDLEIASANMVIEQQDKALKLSGEVTAKSQKEINKLKTRNFLNKVYVGAGVVGGFILGGYLSK